jgi:tol-pal system beta propeller repeat protein TolB
MKPDGSDLQKLTNTSGLDAFPVVSNDGSKIAFSSTRGSGGLFIMDADGSNVEQVISNASAAYGLSWSPDDTKLVYTGTVNKKSQLMIINTDGTGKEQLTTDGGVYPSWSPDGSKIAFSSHRDRDNEIYTINPDGTGLTQITDNYVTGDVQPRWSPDGSKILFRSDRIDAGYDIYTMDSDGTNVQRITYGKSYNGNISWSPDGSEIVFESDRTGDREIFKINADGSGTATNLTNSASTRDTFPFWGPIK